jgi:hypothetical protein
VAGQDGTEIGNQAAEQLVGGDRCLTGQLVSAGPIDRRLLGPGSTALYVGLITRRPKVRIQSPLPERRPLGASVACGLRLLGICGNADLIQQLLRALVLRELPLRSV